MEVRILELNKLDIIESVHNGYIFSEKKNLENCKIYSFENSTGYGEMRCYNLFKGIQLSYNNLNMETAFQKIKPKNGILQIDHCLEGCYEFKLKNSDRALIGKGDLSIIEIGKIPFEESRIPTKKYKGLSLFIDIDLAQESIDKLFPFSKINLVELRDRLCKDGGALIIHSRHEIDHVISELYSVDSRIRLPYSIIKTIELLLFLDLVEGIDTSKLTSFSEPVYQATMECYKAILNNPFEKYSITELSKKYNISESSLKRCFIYITGSSIGNFIRENSLEAAAKMLVHKPLMSIGEIAELSGYLNPSKFSKAFKKHFDQTPQEYRNKSI